ncbi:GntR family transcriptional regulator [Algirhabdus cladophorae]|uniref:GntR family transcriptional regulator n=1 Tax=Algirhabdus cladophorae TaxID=3377108 RepID=UPI003B847349
MPKSSDAIPHGGLAYDRLIAALRSGDLQPGDRLREVELSQDFALSRTPIREALRALEADGIVEHKPRLGAVVRRLGYGEVVELYETRVVLERTAAQLAAQHATAAEIDEMTDLNADIAATSDPSVAAGLNQNFHRCLYLATRNRFLGHAARSLNNALMLLGPTTLADEARIQTVTAQHDLILKALRARDSAAAGAAAEEHLQTSLRHRLKVLRE